MGAAVFSGLLDALRKSPERYLHRPPDCTQPAPHHGDRQRAPLSANASWIRLNSLARGVLPRLALLHVGAGNLVGQILPASGDTGLNPR